MMVAKIVNNIFYFYYVLILLRVFLTWIPSIDWFSQPFRWMREVTDPYLNLFRKLIPTAGGFDFSPIIAIIALQVLQILFANIASAIFNG